MTAGNKVGAGFVVNKTFTHVVYALRAAKRAEGARKNACQKF